MNVNTNTKVKVVLTDYGMECLTNHCKTYRAQPPTNNQQEFTLWEVMNIFGPYLYHGNPRVPFEGNAIDFLEVNP